MKEGHSQDWEDYANMSLDELAQKTNYYMNKSISVGNKIDNRDDMKIGKYVCAILAVAMFVADSSAGSMFMSGVLTVLGVIAAVKDNDIQKNNKPLKVDSEKLHYQFRRCMKEWERKSGKNWAEEGPW